jgi:hypothetical protein
MFKVFHNLFIRRGTLCVVSDAACAGKTYYDVIAIQFGKDLRKG